MAKGASYHVQFRRRRDGKTNFHRRQRLLRSGKNRLVVRRSNKHERVSIVIAKVIGDETLVDASSQHLKKYGWKGATGNVPSAYLTGYLAGKYARAVGVKDAILDIGVNTCRKDTRISAMLAGAVHAGLKIPHDDSVFPSEDRYTGKTIANYAADLKKKSAAKYDKQFSGYKKTTGKPESLPTYFNATIKAIDSELASGSMKAKLGTRNKQNKASKTKAKTAPKKTPTTKPKTTPKKAAPAKKSTTTTTKKPAIIAKKPTTTTTKKPTTEAKKPTTEAKKPSTTKKTTSSTAKKPTTKKTTDTKSKK
ncbi:MAG: 50S ribosomal protein L18 [Candidatus Heimdallarchaeota archaeon]|nr:50S ribosomal protein L18 [Candidatus Heimdallarchaeota archaeon]